MRLEVHRQVIRLLLLAMFVAGLCGAILPRIYNVVWDFGIFDDLGKALLIASILGFTVEPSLRRALARDVFSAAFGYHMPQDFREEIARISQYRVMCIKHIMDVRIREIDNERVMVHVAIERTFENFGSVIAPIHAMNWIDE